MREITNEELALIAGGDTSSDIPEDFGTDGSWEDGDIPSVTVSAEPMNQDAKDLYDAQQDPSLQGYFDQIMINVFGNPNYK